MATNDVFTSYQEFQRKAAEQQKSFYHHFGDREWDSIDKTDPSNALNTKLAMALYGISYDDCNDEQILSLEATRNKIFELTGSGQIRIMYVFISVLLKEEPRTAGIFPLVCTKSTYKKEIFFIEAQPGRVYTGWLDVLQNINLPECDMCFPVGGSYSKSYSHVVRVEFRESPSCNRVLKVLDKAATTGKVASAGVLAAAVFFPVTTPFMVGAGIVLGTTTIFSTTRAASKLIDRSCHHQPINLRDGESAILWLSMTSDIVGSIMLMGAAAIPRLVASGVFEATTTLEVLKWVSVGLSGFGLLANISVLIIKWRQGTLSWGDLKYFIMSCLFIANMAICSWQAQRIIQILSNQPLHLCNIFKMAANTSFEACKSVITVDSLTAAVEIICGSTVINSLLNSCNMRNTTRMLRSVSGILRSFRRGTETVANMCLNLYELLYNHLDQVLVEVTEAWKYLRSLRIRIRGCLMFQTGRLPAVEILRSVNRVLDTVGANVSGAVNAPTTADTLDAADAFGAAHALDAINAPSAPSALSNAEAQGTTETVGAGNAPDKANAPGAASALPVNSLLSSEVILPRPESRNVTRKKLIHLAVLFATNVKVQSEKEFSNLCQILMNDVINRCEQRMVVQAAVTSSLSAEMRDTVLQEVLRDFEEKFEQGEIGQLDLGEVDRPSDSPFLMPLYCEEEHEMFIFEVNMWRFDQFVYDATQYLFHDGRFLDLCEIHISGEPVILIQSLGKSAIFAYKQVENSETFVGTVVLRL